MSNLLTRIEDLARRVRDEDKQELIEMRKEVERLLLLNNIKEHDAVKYIVSKYADQVSDIDKVLKMANSTMLNDKDRDCMIYKKEFMLDFLSMFVDIEKMLNNIEKEVKENEDFIAQG